MTKLNELVETAKTQLESIEQEVTKFVEKNNKSAATRARVQSMDLIKKLKEIRVEIQKLSTS